MAILHVIAAIGLVTAKREVCSDKDKLRLHHGCLVETKFGLSRVSSIRRVVAIVSTNDFNDSISLHVSQGYKPRTCSDTLMHPSNCNDSTSPRVAQDTRCRGWCECLRALWGYKLELARYTNIGLERGQCYPSWLPFLADTAGVPHEHKAINVVL